jgi:predicted acylesterase/phospholipase RssA
VLDLEKLRKIKKKIEMVTPGKINGRRRRDTLRNIRGDGLLTLHSQYNDEGAVEDDDEFGDELVERQSSLNNYNNNNNNNTNVLLERMHSEEAMALRNCALCDTLTDSQILEILEHSRIKQCFHKNEDVSDTNGVFTRRGEEIAILCRGSFAIESITFAQSSSKPYEEVVVGLKSSYSNSNARRRRPIVSARTVVSKIGACVGSLVDVLEYSPMPLADLAAQAQAETTTKTPTVDDSSNDDIINSMNSDDNTSNKLRCVSASDDATFLIVPLRAFHDAINRTVGAHALALRLVNAARCVCNYLSAEAATKPLWVDEPPTTTTVNNGEKEVLNEGDHVKRGLERVLGTKKAQKVDRSEIARCLRELAQRTGTVLSGRVTPLLEKQQQQQGEERTKQGSGAMANRVGFVKRLFASPIDDSSAAAGKGKNKNNKKDEATIENIVEQEEEKEEEKEEVVVYEATMECRYYAPGQLVCALGSPGAAYFIECGTLEASFVKNIDIDETAVVWRAHPGDVVQPFALLANTRSSVELRAGSSGAVVATLVSSEFHKLARYRDDVNEEEEHKTELSSQQQKKFSSVFTKIAADLAKRARYSLAGEALRFCGCEWNYVQVGERIRRLDDIASNGVMIVATGCCRVEAATYTKGAFSGLFSPRWTSLRSSSHDGVSSRLNNNNINNNANSPIMGAANGEGGDDEHSASYSSAGGLSGELLPGMLKHQNSTGNLHGTVAPIFSIPARYVGPGEPCSEELVLFDDENGALEDGENDEIKERSQESIDDEYLRQKYKSNNKSGNQSYNNNNKKMFLLARAARDSQTLFVPGASLDNLAMRHPKKFLQFVKAVGARQSNSQLLLASSSIANSSVIHAIGTPKNNDMHQYDEGNNDQVSGVQQRRTRADKPKLVAVVPVSPGAALHLDAFVSSLMLSLRRICTARVADSADHLAEVGSAAVGALAKEATAFWLHQLEETHDVVLLKGDPFPSAWCAQCASHADVVLLVASAEDEPPVPEEGKALQQRLLGLRRHHQFNLGFRELVLLHEDANDSVPTNTRPWLEAFGVHRHHHVGGKLGGNHGLHQSHAGRLARSLRRLSVGVVFGGGGARGCAHVGALVALEEEGIPIDAIGGTSMGAFIGGNYAREPSVLSTRVKAKRFAKSLSGFWNKISDLTLPIVAYFSGFRTNGAIKAGFRDSKIEDCWLPFFCMTLDLVSSRSIAHRNGTLWRYVRASMALVGFLPPLCDKLDSSNNNNSSGSGYDIDAGRLHVLVDGGYANNVPADVMKDLLGANTVIAVDVGGEGLESKKFEKTWGDGVSGISHVLRRFLTPKWLGLRSSCPTMAEMQAHLPFITDANTDRKRRNDVDVYVRPDVQSFGILEFSSSDAIERKGYESTKAMIREWKLQQPELWNMIRRSCPDQAFLGTKPSKAATLATHGSYDDVRSVDENETNRSNLMGAFFSGRLLQRNKKHFGSGRRSIEDLDSYRNKNNTSPSDVGFRSTIVTNNNGGGSNTTSPTKVSGRYSGREFDQIQRFNSVQLGQKPSMQLNNEKSAANYSPTIPRRKTIPHTKSYEFGSP